MNSIISEIEFDVPGKPFAKQRPRMMKNGHTYTPKETKHYEEWVRNSYSQVDSPYFTGEISVFIDARFPYLKSWSKKKRRLAIAGEIYPTKKPDCDNIAKAILDALNGIAFKDDSQVIYLRVRKRYGEPPGVTVRIKGYEEEYEFND